MSFSSYPQYKDSGVSWLGKIPIHWNVVPAKYKIKTISGGQTIKNLVSNEPLDGLYPAFSASGQDIWMEEYEFDVNGVVLSAVGARCGKTFKANDKWGVVANTHCLFPKQDVDRDYIWYLTNREDWWEKGGTAQPFVKVSDSLAKKIAIPSLDEQRKIAIFLDHETLKIDKLVNEQEKLIGLLKEKRQAVITDAVTKGLNPKSSLKDSGVEWLGAIPESWSVIKLKKITSRISSGKTPSGGAEIYVDTGVIFLRSQNVYDEGLRLEDVVRIPEKIDAEMSSSRVIGGDILLNITGGSIGRSCCVPHDLESANVNQHVCAIRLRQSELVAFVELFFKSDIIKRQIDYVQNGAAREGLNFEQIGNFSICIPPLEERKLIVENVQAKIKHFSELTSQINQSISLLQERRSALISAAVCGLIDVRTTNGN